MSPFLREPYRKDGHEPRNGGLSPFLRDALAVTLSALAVMVLGLVYLFPPIV